MASVAIIGGDTELAIPLCLAALAARKSSASMVADANIGGGTELATPLCLASLVADAFIGGGTEMETPLCLPVPQPLPLRGHITEAVSPFGRMVEASLSSHEDDSDDANDVAASAPAGEPVRGPANLMHLQFGSRALERRARLLADAETRTPTGPS